MYDTYRRILFPCLKTGLWVLESGTEDLYIIDMLDSFREEVEQIYSRRSDHFTL